MASALTFNFSEIRMNDVNRVGGKNASLGELFSALKPKGVGVLDGFAVTTDAYWLLLNEQGLRGKLESIFANLDPENLEQLASAGHEARTQILQTPLPDALRTAVLAAYHDSAKRLGREPEIGGAIVRQRRGFAGSLLCGGSGDFSERARRRRIDACLASVLRLFVYRSRHQLSRPARLFAAQSGFVGGCDAHGAVGPG